MLARWPSLFIQPATTAAGALLSYIAETQKLELSYISKLDFYAVRELRPKARSIRKGVP